MLTKEKLGIFYRSLMGNFISKLGKMRDTTTAADNFFFVFFRENKT